VKGATILVVEDNPITRRMMRFALESEGLRVLEAGEGRTALDLARTQVPDLVLQDYVLPDMDGLQLVEALRALPGTAATPIIVITGMVSQLDDLRRRGLPHTMFLAKPMEPSRLLEVVRSHLAAPAPSSAAGRRVLVVDDEPLNVKLAALRLRDAGFDVETAGGAEEALQSARARVPDAILSDVLMPGIDGFLLCDTVRRDPRLAQVPVVLLSASYVDDADQALAREMGASALVVRTPDFASAITALGDAVRRGAAVPVAADGQEREALHKERLQIQLERQLARNDALLRQGAIQAAALSVVRGLAEALAKPRDLASVLGDVLVHCLDATGLSTGLLYLVAPDGTLQLRAQAGLPAEARAAAAACFGHAQALRRILDGTAPVAFSAARGTEVELRSLTQQLGRTSVLVIPFVVAEERVGVLLLAADEQDFADPAWLGFASTLARQFGQTIAVGQSLFRGAASEARYRTLMEQANDAILLVDNGGIVEANQRAEALLGRNRSAIVGRRFDEFVAPTHRGAAVLYGGETTRTVDQLLARADGTTVSVDVSASPVRIGEDTIVLLILRDITERKRAEKQLKDSEEQYRLLFDSNPHPIWVYHPLTLAFLAVNDAAVHLYGYTRDEFLAMTIKDIRPAEEVPRMLRVAEVAAKGAQPTEGTGRHCRRDGTIMDVDIRSHGITFHGQPACLVLAMDVSEKRRLETQLRQAQKMEAVGRLAGGVAHDFNNLLGVISGYSELLGKSLGPEHPGQRRVAEIQKAADRASALTRQLLAFSRKQVLETKVLKLNDVVTGLAGMLHRLIGEDVRLVTRPRADLGQVRADQGQLEQVIVNLVVNARDAMARGGDLIIETANTTIDEAYCRQHADVTPGRYVTIAVSDTGEGMSAETQSHIFEPFFTTKEDGKGTGLGLATVFGIVKQSGGHVTVYSELGKGSTFRVYLPRTDEAAVPEVAAPAVSDLTGHETILLVEDAETLRMMTREILEGAGYAVIEAANPAAVLERLSSLDAVDVLLTDVVMPGMSGLELAKDLRRTRPDLKILFMSGYTDQALENHGVFDTEAQFLQKPFTTDSLLRKVRAVLGARAG
jgi:PAS domain S-box-containing protein